MMRQPIRNLVFGCLLLVCCSPSLQAGQQNSFEEQTRQIRIKKIATEWQGSMLTLHTRAGKTYKGRLKEVSGDHFLMAVGTDLVNVPLADVVAVSFDPGAGEFMLSLTSTIMGGAFLSGALVLTSDEASSGQISIAVILGCLAGGLWGYSTFYESEVIELE